MNVTARNFLLVLSVAGLGYFLWSFFIGSRYQSLCQISYWTATDAQLRACDEMRSSLPRN